MGVAPGPPTVEGDLPPGLINPYELGPVMSKPCRCPGLVARCFLAWWDCPLHGHVDNRG
jgi:hypothetical protein